MLSPIICTHWLFKIYTARFVLTQSFLSIRFTHTSDVLRTLVYLNPCCRLHFNWIGYIDWFSIELCLLLSFVLILFINFEHSYDSFSFPKRNANFPRTQTNNEWKSFFFLLFLQSNTHFWMFLHHFPWHSFLYKVDKLMCLSIEIQKQKKN